MLRSPMGVTLRQFPRHSKGPKHKVSLPAASCSALCLTAPNPGEEKNISPAQTCRDKTDVNLNELPLNYILSLL